MKYERKLEFVQKRRIHDSSSYLMTFIFGSAQFFIEAGKVFSLPYFSGYFYVTIYKRSFLLS